MASTASRLSYNLSRKGQLNTLGITSSSKKTVEDLLLTDAEKHHCYFRSAGLHNHLSHHLLAAYDLGATSSHLKKICDAEATLQRPIFIADKDATICIDDENWDQHLGNQNAYGSFFQFFSGKVAELGPGPALEKYVFDRSVNVDGKDMLIRLMSGAVHPHIQIGYGLEFGNDTLVATGLAQTAIHTQTAKEVYELHFEEGKPDISGGLSVLEVLSEVYASEALAPKLPYDPSALFTARMKYIVEAERAAAFRNICSQLRVDASNLDATAEELIWASTLLMSATGKEGRKPRLDFFLMHLVTSSLFLKPYLAILESSVSKANLVRSFLSVLVLLTLARGRPRINPALLMSYTATPRPPTAHFKPAHSALGSVLDNADYNPWPAILTDVIYHPDPHVLKTVRTLAYAAREYGDTPRGHLAGAMTGQSQETHRGTKEMDGTIFVRAAGMVMNYMGWTAHGEEARPDWDRSALGWDAAWQKDVE